MSFTWKIDTGPAMQSSSTSYDDMVWAPSQCSRTFSHKTGTALMRCVPV